MDLAPGNINLRVIVKTENLTTPSDILGIEALCKTLTFLEVTYMKFILYLTELNSLFFSLFSCEDDKFSYATRQGHREREQSV
jgi:hypothetical protein